jgi:hypothetical protein
MCSFVDVSNFFGQRYPQECLAGLACTIAMNRKIYRISKSSITFDTFRALYVSPISPCF